MPVENLSFDFWNSLEFILSVFNPQLVEPTHVDLRIQNLGILSANYIILKTLLMVSFVIVCLSPKTTNP